MYSKNFFFQILKSLFLSQFQTHGAGPMMSQATVEEDGVSWIDEGGSGPCHETGLESSNLSPAEVNRIVLIKIRYI